MTAFLSFSTASCSSTPAHFDVPYSNSGVPLLRPIVQRIRCELAELVQNKKLPFYNNRGTLLEYDYYASMLLSIDANETGSITPSLLFPHTGFSFGIIPSVKQSRQDQISVNLKFSMRQIYYDWYNNPEEFNCPDAETNLAGNLGIRSKVSAALDLEDLSYTTDVTPTTGIFNGIINFTATKSINSAGPTWTLTHFTGPGQLVSASLVNTDKLAFGFAGGKGSNKPYSAKPTFNPTISEAADIALDRALQNYLGTQLNAIRNDLRQ